MVFGPRALISWALNRQFKEPHIPECSPEFMSYSIRLPNRFEGLHLTEVVKIFLKD